MPKFRVNMLQRVWEETTFEVEAPTAAEAEALAWAVAKGDAPPPPAKWWRLNKDRRGYHREITKVEQIDATGVDHD